jgi:hypothetical protein
VVSVADGIDAGPGARLDHADAAPPDGGAGPASRNITNAADVVGAMRPRFRACYQALLEHRNPRAAGRVRLRLRVDCEGRIRSMDAEASGVDRETVECMFATARGDRFDPPEGGSAVVSIPVTFVLQAR